MDTPFTNECREQFEELLNRDWNWARGNGKIKCVLWTKDDAIKLEELLEMCGNYEDMKNS